MAEDPPHVGPARLYGIRAIKDAAQEQLCVALEAMGIPENYRAKDEIPISRRRQKVHVTVHCKGTYHCHSCKNTWSSNHHPRIIVDCGKRKVAHVFGQKCRQCRQRYIPPALVRTALMRAMNLAVLIFTERIHGLDCAPPPFLGRAGGQQHLKELCEECVWQQHDSPEIEWGLNMCRDAESRQAAPAPALRDVHDVRRHAAQAAPAAHAPAAAGPSSPSPTTGTASSAGPASEAEETDAVESESRFWMIREMIVPKSTYRMSRPLWECFLAMTTHLEKIMRLRHPDFDLVECGSLRRGTALIWPNGSDADFALQMPLPETESPALSDGILAKLLGSAAERTDALTAISNACLAEADNLREQGVQLAEELSIAVDGALRELNIDGCRLKTNFELVTTGKGANCVSMSATVELLDLAKNERVDAKLSFDMQLTFKRPSNWQDTFIVESIVEYMVSQKAEYMVSQKVKKVVDKLLKPWTVFSGILSAQWYRSHVDRLNKTGKRQAPTGPWDAFQFLCKCVRSALANTEDKRRIKKCISLAQDLVMLRAYEGVIASIHNGGPASVDTPTAPHGVSKLETMVKDILTEASALLENGAVVFWEAFASKEFIAVLYEGFPDAVPETERPLVLDPANPTLNMLGNAMKPGNRDLPWGLPFVPESTSGDVAVDSAQ